MRRTWIVALLLPATATLADEGMWTFNHFPSDRVQAAYGFAPSAEWLKHVQLSSARIAGGCSAGFVSPTGLILTNHHCARRCIDEISTAQRDHIKNGFYAATLADEAKCPAMEINQLTTITDVTERVNNATRKLQGAKFSEAQKAEFARIEKECATAEDIRCDVVTLYQGGQYQLYKYKRFQDVRLVFAPEHAVAFFGGDPDNFEFPRYDLDVSFLRVYVDGKPASTPDYFRWSAGGAKAGMLTFVVGNPGGTSRLDPISMLKYQRDYDLPEFMFRIAEMRGLLTEFQRRGEEQARISANVRFGLDNGYKALKGRRETLVDEQFFALKAAEQTTLQGKVKAKPELQAKVGSAWQDVDRAVAKLREIRIPLRTLEQRAGNGSQLFGYARNLLRAADELPKPNEQRLLEYTDARLPVIKQRVLSPAPVYSELETTLLTFYLNRMREELGPDNPVVRKVLDVKSPEELARELIKGTKLADLQTRQKLWDSGKKAVDASDDPIIHLVRIMDADARGVRKQYEDEVESVMRKSTESIARARFAIFGPSHYPDATFTLRLSYGQVKGYTDTNKFIEPMTQLGGLFARATGRDPFALPETWIKAKDRIDPRTPLNFATTNDIIGGNSGSPVVNKEGEIVGVVFDGNIQSLGGEYGFDESVNRAVALHSEAVMVALDKVYGAKRLTDEINAARK